MRTLIRRNLAGMLAMAAVVSGGCAAFDSPNLYNRHRLSDITLPRTGVESSPSDTFFYDVSVTAEMPDNDATAEATRLTWLGEWLEQRGMCPAGHDVIKRRPFDFMEDKPARRNLRYEVKCRATPTG